VSVCPSVSACVVCARARVCVCVCVRAPQIIELLLLVAGFCICSSVYVFSKSLNVLLSLFCTGVCRPQPRSWSCSFSLWCCVLSSSHFSELI
jgi:hypothetical protein